MIAVSEDLTTLHPGARDLVESLSEAEGKSARSAVPLLDYLDGLPPITPDDPTSTEGAYVKIVFHEGAKLVKTSLLVGVGYNTVIARPGVVHFSWYAYPGAGYEKRRAYMLDAYDRLGRDLELAGVKTVRCHQASGPARPSN